MKLAFLVSSYRSPQQLLRLLTTLRAALPEAPLVVHHDTFAAHLPPGLPESVGARLLTSPGPIVWGDNTLEAARWRALRTMLDSCEFDHVVMLSEQDYPLTPLSELAAFLEHGGWDAVIDAERADRLPDPGLRAECRRRYGFDYRVLPRSPLPAPGGAAGRAVTAARMLGYRAYNRLQPFSRFYYFPEPLGLPTRFGIRRASVGFRPDFPCWFGSAWYSLSRRAATAVVEFVEQHPEFVRYCERSIIPLESATASIVANDPQLRVEFAPLHHVRWSRSTSGRPDEFTVNDLDELLASGCYFARKFTLGDSAVLDALDQRVLAQRRPAAS